MKKASLILLVLFVFAFGTSSWAQCLEDPNDPGECDTLHVEPWLADTLLEGDGPYFVRVPIYVTNDVPDPGSDKIAGFAIPLCFTSTNAAAKCVIDSLRNSFTDWPSAATDPTCLFRDLDGETNWMASVGQWEIIAIEIDSLDHIWIGGTPFLKPLMDAGTHALLATVTFTVWDTTTICIDTCFWPPNSNVKFVYGSSEIAIPRSGTGTASYEVCIRLQKPSGVREVEDSEDSRPSEFSLSQNYPNPFNPATNFQFSLPKSSHVKIEIFNIVGQKVRTLVDEEMEPGVYVVDWDGKDEKANSVSSGIYFYRMQAGDFSDMKKMVLVK